MMDPKLSHVFVGTHEKTHHSCRRKKRKRFFSVVRQHYSPELFSKEVKEL